MISTAPKTVLAALGLAVGLGMSACSATASGGSSSGSATPAPSAATRTPGAGRAMPGTSGLIAAVTGSTMQVQSRTEQVAVTWTGTTTFTQEVTGSLADVTVGSCITATAAQSAMTATPDTGSAAGLTAAIVQIRPSTNGSCGSGLGGGGANGAGPANGVGAGPANSAGPTTGGGGGNGSGNRSQRLAQFLANGQVTAVSGATITVTTSQRAGATATAAPITVLTTGSTTYLKSATASANDVKVGECATALGKADSTGAITATAVSLRPATNGECTTGFGGPRRGPGSTASATVNG